MNDNVSEHRFGSFSLGDVFDKEIQKKGQFAFRGRQSNVQSSARFIDLFAKSLNTEVENQRNVSDEQRSCFGTEKVEESLSQMRVSLTESSNMSIYPFGTCVDEIYHHSWSNSGWY
jgi:hypothetical protein